MRTFKFNTGVKCADTNRGLSKGEILSTNGVILIPFSCDIPDDLDVTFLFGCDSLNAPYKENNFIVKEIFNSTIISKYAYFRVN